MRLKSFTQNSARLKIIQIEIVLTPGLPVVEFIGNPDKALRESAAKIRSAILQQGYQWPRAQRVLVAMSPYEVVKSGAGIELAIALGILFETAQLDVMKFAEVITRPIYGELSLRGEVSAPSVLKMVDAELAGLVTTGAAEFSLPVATYRFEKLSEFREGNFPALHRQEGGPELKIPKLKWTKEQARLAALLVHGRFHGLLAGAPGSGKTSFLRALISLRQRVSGEIRYLMPHHSVTMQALLGGGREAREGLLGRVHNGILAMDEVIEFEPKVLDSLRESIEQGEQRVDRLARDLEYACRFQLLAATNLCRCGHFHPKLSFSKCRCGSARLRKSLGRLSGPWMDRMTVLVMTHDWNSKGEFTPSQVIDEVMQAEAFSREARGCALPPQEFSREQIEQFMDSGAMQLAEVSSQTTSERRRMALLRGALALANLDRTATIESRHIQESYFYTIQGHEWLDSVAI